MIEIMSIVALVVGILFGFWCFRETVSWLFVILHTSAFSTKEGFYDLYDMADDEVTFKYYGDHNKDIWKYADYLKLHAAARPSAYKTFRNTYNAITKSIFTRTLPIALAPAIIFWSNWYFYMTGIAITLVCLVAYELFRYGFRPGFYQRLVVYTVLSTYSKDKARSDQ